MVEEWVAERDAVLIALDLTKAREMQPTFMSDEDLLWALHMARYECIRISDTLREESKTWLMERGKSRIWGIPWEDTLPTECDIPF